MSRFSEDMQRRILLARITQTALAALIPTDKAHISRLANGQVQPTEDMAKQIDRALKADGKLFALLEQPARAPGPAIPQKMGEQDAAAARDTTQHLVALDTAHGSTGLVTFATRAFRTAADKLAVVGGTADVRSAVADLGAAAAWITSDAVQRDQSRVIALEALALADLANDTRLRRFLLSHLSMVSEHAGRYGDALAYAERVLQQEPTDPRVRAMFQLRRARALSGLGGGTEALDAWDHAEYLLTETPLAEDGLTYWIDPAEMAIHKAVILSRSGDKRAVDWARRGVELLPAGKGRDQVLFRAMLLEDAVTAGAWREVPGTVEELLQYAGSPATARVPELLERVWRSLNARRVPPAARNAIRAALDAFAEPATAT